ncbi:MAG TPA: hypothetical protein VEZ11_03580, partial [Thermoanaerobaculia bacterium]|nr:hypothetical protein [Thermoanaerobaculia bacterium]
YSRGPCRKHVPCPAEVRILAAVTPSDRLHRRLREMLARVEIQRWEARRVKHAHGVWFRLQLLLAETRRTLVITAEEASILRSGGFEPHVVGLELEPPKLLFVVPDGMLPPSVEGRELPIQDGRQILLASAMVLIPF